MQEYEIYISGNALRQFPIDTVFGLLWYNEKEVLEIPKRIPFCGEWGEVLSTSISYKDKFPMPFKLNLAYISLVEEKIYEIEEFLPRKDMERLWEKKLFNHIVIGMAPLGKVAIWFHGYRKSILVNSIQGQCVDIELKGIVSGFNNIHTYCKNIIANNHNLMKEKLPNLDFFNYYMKQFTYRYNVLYEKKKEKQWIKFDENEVQPHLEYIEEALFDGTHDKLHDGSLLKYHQAGKPKKLAIKWHIGKSEYSAYFWFEDERIREVFDKFYGAHPDTKTDFIIRIDAENKKYELALYRYGLKEPQIISEDVYQLLVFKNKFEDYRSDNYNQERGAWIW